MRDSVYVLPVDPRYLSAAVMIWATYTNRMGDTVFLKTCVRRNPSFRLEKWVMGRWVHAYSPPACYGAYDGPPPTVRPGGIHTDSLPIIYAFTPTLREGAGWKVEEFSGIYRLVYQIYRTWTPPDASWPNRGVSGLLPKEQRVSNAFRMIDPTRPGGQRSGSMGRRVTAAAN